MSELRKRLYVACDVCYGFGHSVVLHDGTVWRGTKTDCIPCHGKGHHGEPFEPLYVAETLPTMSDIQAGRLTALHAFCLETFTANGHWELIAHTAAIRGHLARGGRVWLSLDLYRLQHAVMVARRSGQS